MTLKDKLQIVLITYNRKKHLQKTFEQIFAENSPIKDLDITILDNASTDGTSELIQEYCFRFPNLKHTKHKVNIGGNANIVRAYETGASSGKEYVWVLCDDDKYDFSNWREVEQNIEKQKDIICVCDYAIKYPIDKNNSSVQNIFQLSFVPAGIYKACIITEDIINNMYTSIYAMFPQLCPVINVVNQNKEIALLSKPIVFNGLHCDNACESLSYQRGIKDNEVIERYKETSWILGYSNIITLLKDKKLQKKCIRSAILSDEIYGNFDNFYWSMYDKYLSVGRINYIYEIFRYLPIKNFLIFILKSICWKVQHKKIQSNNKTKEDKQYWENYLKKINLSQKLNHLAEKYKDKKILLYGNGIVSQIIQNEYDLSKFNIVGITDRKFLGCDGNYKGKYKTIPPNKLNTVDFDCILACVKHFDFIKHTLRDNGFKQKCLYFIKK